jgi:hypothetical protein
MRARARWIISLIAGAMLAVTTAVVQVAPAQAAVWRAYPPAANRTCAATAEHQGVGYQLCLEFTELRGQVRAIAFVNPGAYTNYQVNLKFWMGGGLNVADSCPTITTNGSRACYTAWQYVENEYVAAEARFGIAGAWMPMQRVIDGDLHGKRQEDPIWCGPAAAQTVISALGVPWPSQQTLANRMNTKPPLGTLYAVMNDAINAYVPQDWPYREVGVPGYGMPRYAGLNRIMESLARGRPVVVMVKPGQLPWSTGSGVTRHFLVVHGYGGVETRDDAVAEVMPWTPQNFKVWDPGLSWDGRPTRGEVTMTVQQLFDAAAGADFPADGLPAISS